MMRCLMKEFIDGGDREGTKLPYSVRQAGGSQEIFFILMANPMINASVTCSIVEFT